MLKNYALRRIMTSTIALIIVAILCFFPKTNQNKIDTITTYQSIASFPIYLLNKDEYVIRTTIPLTNDNLNLKIPELISSLTIGSSKTEYIPKNFTPIIPSTTKLLDFSIKDGLLKLNFSKDFLNVDKDHEEKLIEALTYTLTELKEIKEIMIFIENTKLDVLPQKLPQSHRLKFYLSL